MPARWGVGSTKILSKRLGIPGNALFEAVRNAHSDLDEASFVDAVSRNMRRGRFLLLIVGDGIREGVAAIAEFVHQHSGLQFTFGLVEMPIFECPNGDRVVHPRVLAKTTIIERTVVELASDQMGIRPAGGDDVEASDDTTGEFYPDFWGELLRDLRLDAVDQPLPNPGRLGNISFRLQLPGGYNLWITAYRNHSDGDVGVFVGSRQGTVGVEVQEKLREFRDEIDRDLGFEVD